MPDTKRTLRIVPADHLGQAIGGVPEYRARTSDTERLWAFFRHLQTLYALQGVDYGKSKLTRTWRKVPPKC